MSREPLDGQRGDGWTDLPPSTISDDDGLPEPMTERQAAYYLKLCAKRGIEPDLTMSKAEAIAVIGDMRDEGGYPTRIQVRSVACPVCRAASGTRCVGDDEKPRERNHRRRVDAYRARP